MRTAGARQGRPAGVVALALVAVLALAAAACTDDGPDTSSAETVPPGPAPQEPSEVGDGCGDRAATDPSDLSADRVVARCGSGSPEARPLPTRTPLRVAVPPEAGEEQAPVLLAHELGEFEDENLAVEIVERDLPAAMADLAAGRVDVVVGPLNGPFFDAVHDGTGARAVLGGALTRVPNRLTSPQTGLWLRRSAVPDDKDLGDLQSQPVGVPGGVAGAALYPVSHLVEQRNAATGNMSVVDVSGDEAAEQLESGELAAAWLDGASWRSLAGDSGFELLATLPATESIDGTVFSRRLTAEDREVGLAYVRAVIRTINTDLSGDYQSDGDVVAALARATGLDEDVIADTRPLLFDWEIRDGTLPRIEDVLLTTGGVAYDSPQPREDLVDRTLASEAVGAAR
jgi:NitT/TauT family transport system substrate-binding protein